MPYARDPIRNEDVEIDCHPVHAASGPEDIGDHVVEILGRSFDHDPVEACQGSYSLLVEHDGCPDCGCNRAVVTVETLAGVRMKKCPACDTVHDHG